MKYKILANHNNDQTTSIVLIDESDLQNHNPNSNKLPPAACKIHERLKGLMIVTSCRWLEHIGTRELVGRSKDPSSFWFFLFI
jgi:hypothetical protein